MNLKIRYASALLLVTVLLILYSWAIVFSFNRTYYILTVFLCVLLYFTTFQLGKKLSHVFFTLSFLQYMKKKNGVVNKNECTTFIEKRGGTRLSDQEIHVLAATILATLVKERIIELHGDKYTLIFP